jgi:hypothetical protein
MRTATDSQPDVTTVLTPGDGLLSDPSCSGIPDGGYEAGTATCHLIAPDAEADGAIVCMTISAPANSWNSIIVACTSRDDSGVCGPPLSPRGGVYCCFAPDRTYTSMQWCVPADGFAHFFHANLTDTDGDTIPDVIDNCPNVSNPRQDDTDGDGIGDACDNCPYTYNPDQSLSDAGIGTACECAQVPTPPLGANGCPCADGGATASPDAGDLCHLVVLADAGVSTKP